TVFAVDINGTGYTNLHSFTGGSGSYPNITNSDGAYPQAGLILAGNTLYGTAYYGGSSGNGTVFKINVDGTGFTDLYSFSAFGGYLSNATIVLGTNSDGANPVAALMLSGNTLYGTAYYGGSSGNGTLFTLETD